MCEKRESDRKKDKRNKQTNIEEKGVWGQVGICLFAAFVPSINEPEKKGSLHFGQMKSIATETMEGS
jgi:hypothetical protein